MGEKKLRYKICSTPSYFLRRLFEKYGFDDNLFHIVAKISNKIKKSASKKESEKNQNDF